MAYDDLDDSTLSAAYIEKYPVYKEQVIFEQAPIFEEPAPIEPQITEVPQDYTAIQEQPPVEPLAQAAEQLAPQPIQDTVPPPMEQLPLDTAITPQPLDDPDTQISNGTPLSDFGYQPPSIETPTEIDPAAFQDLAATGQDMRMYTIAGSEGPDLRPEVIEEYQKQIEFAENLPLWKSPEQQAEEDFDGKKDDGAFKQIWNTIRGTYGKLTTPLRDFGGQMVGEGEKGYKQIQSEKYFERLDELVQEDQQKTESERIAREDDLADTGFREAQPSATMVKPELPPGEEPEEIETSEALAIKSEELLKDIKSIPWKAGIKEFIKGSVEDLPVLLAGFGTVKKLKNVAATAKKFGSWQKAFSRMTPAQKRSLLAVKKGTGLKGVAQKGSLKAFEAYAKLPGVVQKAIGLNTEVGILLTPEVLRTGKLPSIDSYVETAAFVGGLHGLQKAYKTAKQVLGKIKDKRIKIEPEIELKGKVKAKYAFEEGVPKAPAKKAPEPKAEYPKYDDVSQSGFKVPEGWKPPVPVKPKPKNIVPHGARPKKVPPKTIEGYEEYPLTYKYEDIDRAYPKAEDLTVKNIVNFMAEKGERVNREAARKIRTQLQEGRQTEIDVQVRKESESVKIHSPKETPIAKGEQAKFLQNRMAEEPVKVKRAKPEPPPKKALFSRFQEAKVFMEKGGRKVTDKQVLDKIESGERLLAAKKFDTRPARDRQIERTEIKTVTNELLENPKMEARGYEDKSLKAKDLPDKFTLGGQEWLRKKSRTPGVVKFNLAKDPFNTPMERSADELIIIDGKKKVDKKEPEYTEPKDEDLVLFEPTQKYDASRPPLPTGESRKNLDKFMAESKVKDAKGQPIPVFRGDFNVENLNVMKGVSDKEGGSGGIYFTDNPSIASGYTDKMFFEGTYDEKKYFEFKYKGKGYSVENTPPLSQRNKDFIAKEIEERFNVPKHVIERDLKKHKGDALKGAHESLVLSGAIYPANDFDDFLSALPFLDDAFYNDPNIGRKGVSSTYLSIKKPWNVQNPNKKDLDLLKRVLPPKDHTLYALKQKGTVVTLTDEAKRELKNLGYDGIKDEGGAITGSDAHNVFIAFESNQIKSATGNIGKFDPKKPSIVEEQQELFGEKVDLFDKKLDTKEHEAIKKTFDKIKPSEPDAATKKAGKISDASTKRLGTPKLSLRGDKPGVPRLRETFVKEYKETGYIDLVGQKVESADDMAAILEVFRNPYYETFRMVYVKNGAVVGYDSFSSRKPGMSMISPSGKWSEHYMKMGARAERLGADTIYPTHNHPSGNPTPSESDIIVQKHLKKIIEQQVLAHDGKLTKIFPSGVKLGDHVVTNHKKYTLINGYGETTLKQMYNEGLAPDPLLKEKYPSYLKHKVTKPDHIMKISQAISKSINKEDITAIFISGNVSRGVTSIPREIWNNKEGFRNYLENLSDSFGTAGIALSYKGSDRFAVLEKLEPLLKSGQVLDFIHYRDGKPISYRAVAGFDITTFKPKKAKFSRVREPEAEYEAPKKSLKTKVKSKTDAIMQRITDVLPVSKKKIPKELRDQYEDWVLNLQSMEFESQKFIYDLKKDMPKLATREAIPFLIEKTGVPKKLNRPDLQEIVKNASPELKAQASKVREHFHKGWEYMQEHIADFSAKEIENYVTHIWNLKDKKQTAETVAWFSTRNPQLKKRFINTYAAGIERGLTPKTLDIAEITAIHDANMISTTENIKILENLKQAQDKDGMKLIMRSDKAPAGWRTIDHPVLRRGMMIPSKEGEIQTMVKMPVRYHPDLEPMMQAIFGDRFKAEGWAGFALKAIENTNAVMKKLSLSLSLFHHGALGETSIATIGPVKTAKIIGKVKKMWYDVPIKGKQDIFEDQFHIAHDGVKHGLQIGASSDVQRDLVTKMLDFAEEKLSSQAKVLGLPVKAISKANEYWDAQLWDYFHNQLKVYGYEHLKNQALKKMKDATAKDISVMKKEVANMINDTYGGQNWKLQMTNPKTLQMAQWALLSPDWLVSTLKQALAPTGIGSYSPQGKSLRRKMGAKFWARAGLYYGIGLGALGYAFSKKDDAEQRGVPFSEGKGSFWWDNDPGHETHLFVGRYPDGSKRYLRWGKQFRELPEFFFDSWAGEISPITASSKKIGGKMSPVVQTVSALMTGKTMSGYSIRELNNTEGNEKAWNMIKHIGKGFVPFSWQGIAKSDQWYLTDFVMPSSKGMSFGKSRKLVMKAIIQKKYDRINDVLRAAAENNLDANAIAKSAVQQLKAEASAEISRDVRKGKLTKPGNIAELRAMVKEKTKLGQKKAVLNNIDAYLKAVESYIRRYEAEKEAFTKERSFGKASETILKEMDQDEKDFAPGEE